MYLPPEARFSKLLNLPEGSNIGQAINDAMRAIETENPDLKDVLWSMLKNVTDVSRVTADTVLFPEGSLVSKKLIMRAFSEV